MEELLCCPYCIPNLKLTAWEPVNQALLTVYYGSDTTISYTLCHSGNYFTFSASDTESAMLKRRNLKTIGRVKVSFSIGYLSVDRKRWKT